MKKVIETDSQPTLLVCYKPAADVGLNRARRAVEEVVHAIDPTAVVKARRLPTQGAEYRFAQLTAREDSLTRIFQEIQAREEIAFAAPSGAPQVALATEVSEPR